MLTTDPKILGIALVGGLLPSLLWLWFWLREDKEEPEPKGLLFISFVVGMIAVIFILPIEKFIQTNINSEQLQIISWATVEELIKYIVILIIFYQTNFIRKPIDWPIYLITVALGFAAMENTLFLIKPILLEGATVSLLTGQLRFLGSTLLHTVASGIIGISIGISFFMNQSKKKLFLFIGLISAIGLHSIFNFSIMKASGSDLLKVFAFLWVATIINLLLFEKLRRMSKTDKIAR